MSQIGGYSAKEIKHNNDIDWCRFFGATGRSSETDLVEVRSERPEITFDADGVYIVRGAESSLSLTVPESVTLGDETYTCAGYRVETWDAAAKTWGNPVEAVGTACEISGTTLGANRRVTWLWTRTGSLRAATDYDVSDYVQNGLVAHFDGIRNEGADIAHGAAANMHWRNLVTDGPDARLSKLTSYVPDGAVAGVWMDNGYQFNGLDYYAFADTFALGGAITAQVFVDYNRDESDNVSSYPGFLGSVSEDTDNFFIYAYKGKTNQLLFKTRYGTGKNGYGFKNWTASHVSVLFDKDGGRFGFNQGGNTDWVTECTLSEIPSLSYAIGTAYLSEEEKKNRMLVGKVYSVRLYNRVLTEAEMAHNRRIDEIRFQGIGDVTLVNGAVGDTGTIGESSCSDGVYNILSDSWTFTASDIKIEDKTYRPRLIVGTWDGEKWVESPKIWTYKYDYSNSHSSRIRLKWVWEAFTGLVITIR